LSHNFVLNKKIKNIKFKYEKNNFVHFNFNKDSVKKFINEINKRLKFSNNLKFIGGGANFTTAQFLANKVCKLLNISCAFDTLENHKHIDMSAEPNLIILIANISNSIYLSDAYAEIDKFISHNNFPFIVTNNADNKCFKKLKNSQIMQIPYMKKEISLIFYQKLFEQLYK
jgi:glucosamine 6-phosphate synthetase-like amidotransferase/phosphosugar isomerase protein|tara:strand:+ start:170 stop:682 length:513 start_codon:yes stop_codon:yes gene_type:complete